MKKMATVLFSLSALFFINTASAGGDISAMLGKWAWEGFTIEVNKCESTEICAKVVAGPKNIGLQMIKSKLTYKARVLLEKSPIHKQVTHITPN